jgi:4-amino-4-deoxy-L-arabinose transferase-like glycosyltransferase
MYSVVANEIVDGGHPYVDAVERKPPLLFWTYAAVFKVAGKFNWKALHFVALLWTLGAMAGLYVIGYHLFDRNTGLIAALFYSVFQPWGTWVNLSADGEMLMNLPIIWAWAIAFCCNPSPMRPKLFAAGALLAAAFLLKQPAAIAAVPLGIYLLLPSYRANRNLTRTNSIIQATMLTLGFFGTLGVVTIILWKQGILRESFYWTIADHDIPHVFWQKGIVRTLAFLRAIARSASLIGNCMRRHLDRLTSLRPSVIQRSNLAPSTRSCASHLVSPFQCQIKPQENMPQRKSWTE